MSVTIKNTGPEIVTIACGAASFTLPPGCSIETKFNDDVRPLIVNPMTVDGLASVIWQLGFDPRKHDPVIVWRDDNQFNKRAYLCPSAAKALARGLLLAINAPDEETKAPSEQVD